MSAVGELATSAAKDFIPARPSCRLLMGLADDVEAHSRSMAFEQGLEWEGWSLGQNLRIEYAA
jgi:hypothetical protein